MIDAAAIAASQRREDIGWSIASGPGRTELG
jgi:hypothetical protein